MSNTQHGIKVDDLLVGEHNAMQVAAAVWALLYKVQTSYLKQLIDRLETDSNNSSKLALPLFKLILFYATNLQEHIKNDKALLASIDAAQERAQFRAMFGGPPGDEGDD
jgi:hypothetical protein